MKAFFIIKIKIIDYINILGGMKNEIDRRANANNYERCRWFNRWERVKGKAY